MGQVSGLWGSIGVCRLISHYIDGAFFAAIGNLLGVMMTYKLFDSLTTEERDVVTLPERLSWTRQARAPKQS